MSGSGGPVATEEDTIAIINNYDREDDEDMIFEMVISSINVGGADMPCFMCQDDMQTLVEAYTSGKHVVLHFPAIESANIGDTYYSIIGCDTTERDTVPSGGGSGEVISEQLPEGIDYSPFFFSGNTYFMCYVYQNEFLIARSQYLEVGEQAGSISGPVQQ